MTDRYQNQQMSKLTYVSIFMLPMLLACLYTCAFTIDEGHVGVLYTFGSLSSKIYEPGLNFKLPLITTVHQVQVTIQTDAIRQTSCGTNSGVTIYFDKI